MDKIKKPRLAEYSLAEFLSSSTYRELFVESSSKTYSEPMVRVLVDLLSSCASAQLSSIFREVAERKFDRLPKTVERDEVYSAFDSAANELEIAAQCATLPEGTGFTLRTSKLPSGRTFFIVEPVLPAGAAH